MRKTIGQAKIDARALPLRAYISDSGKDSVRRLSLRFDGELVTFSLSFDMGGKFRRHVIGRSNTLSLDDARNLARQLKARMASEPGFDPASGAKLGEAGLFRPLAEAFVDARRGGNAPRAAKTIEDYERYLLTYAMPLHLRPVAQITKAEVAALIAKVEAERSSTVARVLALNLSSFFSWLEKRGIIEINFVPRTLKPAAPPPRSRVLSAAELRRIWAVTGSGDDYDRIIRLLILSGQRLREIGELHWSEVGDGMIRFDPKRVKNRSTHIVPLCGTMQAVLGTSANGFVFGRDEGPFAGYSRAQARLLKRLDGMPHWSPHDLRRSFDTGMRDLGVSGDVVESLLNHKPQGARKHYDSSQRIPEKAAALARWADHITGGR